MTRPAISWPPSPHSATHSSSSWHSMTATAVAWIALRDTIPSSRVLLVPSLLLLPLLLLPLVPFALLAALPLPLLLACNTTGTGSAGGDGDPMAATPLLGARTGVSWGSGLVLELATVATTAPAPSPAATAAAARGVAARGVAARADMLAGMAISGDGICSTKGPSEEELSGMWSCDTTVEAEERSEEMSTEDPSLSSASCP
mmetsp:Transcript_27448/g.69816  ORF Transcript_27448/g.69816 Transcript_27448/m.69816 type:complete len:202 (+) Transcript_27448:1182-1787(+)